MEKPEERTMYTIQGSQIYWETLLNVTEHPINKEYGRLTN